MKIHALGYIPEDDYMWDDHDYCELEEWDIERIPKHVDEIWYWYSTGSYCGDGYILMRSGRQYDIHCCSHCSCYGPTEDIKFEGAPFADLFDGTGERNTGLYPLLLWKKNGRKPTNEEVKKIVEKKKGYESKITKVKDLMEKLKECDPETAIIVADSQGAIWLPEVYREEPFNPKNFENGDLNDMKKVEKIIVFEIYK